MPRTKLDAAAVRRGRRLAEWLTAARRRSGRSAEVIARKAGVSVETVRSIEGGRTLTPEFFTVAAITRALAASLDEAVADVLEIEAE